MTELRSGRERDAALSSRLDTLSELLRLGEGRLDESTTGAVRTVLDRAGDRLRLSVDHTVIALAGTTGSGKSSLFNAIAGIDLSPVGVRRPTTGATHACVWGLESSRSLLEWLEIETRHRYARGSALDSDEGSSFQGLVLLDLPDHDSTAQRHRQEVDRLVSVADLVVWVVDPQKYADAAVHDGYLRRSAGHSSVTAVVLNQVDKLGPAQARECVDDLRELLRSGGASPPVIATSASTGTGLDEFRALIADTLARRQAAVERLDAEVLDVVGRLLPYGEPEPPDVDPAGRDAVVERLAEASGVPAAAQAAQGDHRRRGARRVAWPFAAAVRGIRSDPFRRARLGREAGQGRVAPGPDHVPAQPAMVRNSMPGAAELLTGALPKPWSDAVERAGRRRVEELPDALGDAVTEACADTRSPRWWWVAAVVQWLLCLYAFAGAAWTVCILAFGYADSGAGMPEMLRDTALLPYAVLAAAEGLLAGAILGWLARGGVRRSAREHHDAVRARATAGVESVAEERVFAPVQQELDRYAQFHRLLRTASCAGPEETSTRSAPD